MRYALMFTYKADQNDERVYCFDGHRRTFGSYNEAVAKARMAAESNPDKLVYVTRLCSVSKRVDYPIVTELIGSSQDTVSMGLQKE